MTGHREHYHFNELLLCAIEGDLPQDQVEEFNRLILNDPENVRHYLELVNLYSELSPYGRIGYINSPSQSDPHQYDLLLKSLASQENTSPGIEIQKTDPAQTAPAEKIRVDKVRYLSMNKTSLLSIFLSAAAVLFVVLFARFAPSKSNVEVALLTESLNARWGETNMPTRIGTRIATADHGTLVSGIVEFTFDNGVEVIIEGPSQFQFLTPNELRLNRGRLFTRVPKTGKGFSVAANNSRVIVFGTEFGVTASEDGNDELHVFKGTTTLIAGAQKEEKQVTQVSAGHARRVTHENASIAEIQLEKGLFAQNVHSSSGLIWRGENADLASLMVGQNGFSLNPGVYGINPENGDMSDQIKLVFSNSSRQFVPVPHVPFIDGVFSPVEGPVRITSTGLQFTCPKVKDIYTHFIGVIYGRYTEEQFHLSRLLFNGQRFDASTAPLVFLHSNLGITYDLSAAEKSMGLQIAGFRSEAALAEVKEQSEAFVDFWIYVDGQLKFVQKEWSSRSPSVALDIPIAPEDRFLTLIVTDCSQRSDDQAKSHAEDCFFLIRPRFVLTGEQ